MYSSEKSWPQSEARAWSWNKPPDPNAASLPLPESYLLSSPLLKTQVTGLSQELRQLDISSITLAYETTHMNACKSQESSILDELHRDRGARVPAILGHAHLLECLKDAGNFNNGRQIEIYPT